ncbi:Putative uncharacterized protein [Moritella viscosa]|uniref:Uncharacterized protein n=1 Tax=Moritella viscosa TaxID=80854 RepID=A0ABY1H9P6_9GAMM|nr:Putative uncharacterized protein [Moritella viscosa]SHO02334.1 Putative uncharacterized protein [Moritella viscosa]SHO20727.1 Putative uncharacterized protein [Moritella viscosa]
MIFESQQNHGVKKTADGSIKVRISSTHAVFEPGMKLVLLQANLRLPY